MVNTDSGLRLTLDNGGAPMRGAPQSLTLSAEEVATLRTIWRCEERVDWAVYDRLKERVLNEHAADRPGRA